MADIEEKAAVVTFSEEIPRESVRKQRVSTIVSHSEEENADNLFHPAEGTPLAEALAANAALKIGKVQKAFQRKWRGIKGPKIKNFNLVRQIKKHKKQKKKLFSKNFKGKVIDGVHELYTLTIGMMLGLRCTIGRCDDGKLSHNELVIEDFSHVEKRTFRPDGTNSKHYSTPPHSLGHTFKFKSYAPDVFQKIRQFSGIDNASYMMSTCGTCNFIEFMSNSKSGQFFFYSHDGKYMIKTQSKEENRFMKKILPYYYQYLMENPNSLLVRFLGMHRVKMYHLRRKHHFVIMNSVFDTPQQIHTIFDLKGSRIGREATEKEKTSGGVLKDNDLVDSGRKWHLGSKKEKIMEQLEKDADFLASMNIMDYSLLVGIHDRKLQEAVNLASNSTTNLPPLASRSNTPFRSKAINSNASSASTSQHPGVGHNTSSGSVVVTNTNVNSSASTHMLGETTVSVDREMDYSTSGLTTPVRKKRQSQSAQVGNGHQANTSAVSAIAASTEEVDIDLIPDDDYDEDEEYDEYDEEGYDLDDEDDDEDLEDESDATDSVFGDMDKDDSHANMEINEREIERLGTILGQGARGPEGAKIAKLFVSADRFAQMTATTIQGDKELVRHMSRMALRQHDNFTQRPWTSRIDGGINSRTDHGRGDEIYFMGVIDILQQYNIRKRSETFFKSFTEDVNLISSVNPLAYAHRFVQFLRENSD